MLSQPFRYHHLAPAAVALVLLVAAVPGARAQLAANPDTFFVPQGQTLQIGAPGVLDNDTVNDQGAGDVGAAAVLVTDVLYGALTLQSDGSFSYTYGAGFDGHDEFTYDLSIGGFTDRTTVVLSACNTGAGFVTCWKETEFLARAQAMGLTGFREGFEDDAAWGGARTPYAQPFVISRGIRWTTNHTDVGNDISTTSGPPRSGIYAGFDPNHGYATGTPAECDVDNPPAHCLYHDGLTGTREPGAPALFGVGTWIDGTFGSNVAISLDGSPPLGGSRISFGLEFQGVIATGPTGFDTFSIVETDGKIGQAFYIFLDDITVLTRPVSAAPEPGSGSRVFFAGAGPNPLTGSTTLRFSLGTGGEVSLAVFDQRGRLVRRLLGGYHEAGDYAVRWDGRDTGGRPAAAGLYFARLETGNGADREIQVRKMVLLQ